MDIFSKKIIISIGLYISILNADKSGDRLVMEAADAFYNYETAQAISLLDSARLQYPDNVYHRGSELVSLLFLLTVKIKRIN